MVLFPCQGKKEGLKEADHQGGFSKIYTPSEDCTGFYNEDGNYTQCPNGTWFNPTLQVCDWPSESGCVVGSGSETVYWGYYNESKTVYGTHLNIEVSYKGLSIQLGTYDNNAKYEITYCKSAILPWTKCYKSLNKVLKL